ncbi:MAG: histidinol dehydrogenase, partial [Epulopiscium sp.]|nr:histidinol dehydrogenase [Candidatus Epulonipiscium sp.]
MIRIINYDLPEAKSFLQILFNRSELDLHQEQKTVQCIVDDIRIKKDEALFDYTKRFDGVILNSSNIKVTQEEIAMAYKQVDSHYISVIQKSIERIEAYHQKQKQNSWFNTEPQGAILGQKITPIESIGVYVPGGKAAYPSSVLMNVIPAKVAGVEKIVMVTPPQKFVGIDPTTLVAAHEAGIKEIYKVGGAQAIAA